ncbi:anaerobic ribonucleoside-triphosphate reductase activating protein, partial [Rhodovulum sulfidophilum]|nr:anaerobic ribonucleoside-triphosphate reductase activating protein [Rhodovulum sulfidophilum]
QKGLPEALAELRAMGFRTGLHTGGAYPARFARVLSLLDWIGFDVKAPFDAYDRITGAPGSGTKARESLGLLRDSGIAADLRCTVHPALLSPADLARMDDDLAALGLPPARRQPFRAEGCTDPALCRTP